MSLSAMNFGFAASITPAIYGWSYRTLPLRPSKENASGGRRLCLRDLFVVAIAWAIIATLAVPAHAGLLLTHESIPIVGTGGSGGSGTSASDMIFNQYSADGWGWAGGAGGVQGNLAVTNNGGTATPANEAFSFNVGSMVDSLNATYGAGNWTIANPTFTFASSYNKQNNSRFGVGSGTFDIFWVGNDNWAQSTGTPHQPRNKPHLCLFRAGAVNLGR